MLCTKATSSQALSFILVNGRHCWSFVEKTTFSVFRSSHGVSLVSDCSKDSEQSTVAEESCAQ